MPYGISDNRLQARFKQLIPETCVHHTPARPGAYVEGKDPNCSLPRQRVSQIFEKFANLGENRDSSRTLHVETTNLEGHTGQQSLLPITSSTAVTLNPLSRSNTADINTPFPEPLLRDLWQTAVKEDHTYELLKNAVIRGDRRFPPDLHTPADIAECTVLNNCLYFRGALWIPSFEPLQTVILHKIHDSLIAGHPGRENTFALLARDFYWPRYS